MKNYSIGVTHWLTLSQMAEISSQRAIAVLPSNIRTRILASREILLHFVKNRLPVYGVSTQFGDDAYRISIEGNYEEYIQTLIHRQNDVVLALDCGLGEICGDVIIRTTLLLRAHTLAQGVSGVRVELIEAILRLLEHNALPLIHKYGSVGASGDLIPLAAIALALRGEGKLRYNNEIRPAREVLKVIGMQPIELQIKEGLAIVNGTSFSTAIAATAIHQLCYILPTSIVASAIAAEAMLAMDSGYSDFVHKIKHHEGQIIVAEYIRKCWHGSQLIRSLDILRQEWRRRVLHDGVAQQEHVQDFYSIRSIAHGFGPFYEDLRRAVRIIEEEMNSANDNPVIDTENMKIHHGANFLSDYVAVISDQLRNDVAKASTWLHALLANLIHPRKNRGLPSNLVRDPNTYTGYKTLQLLAASLAIHNRSRSLPIAAVMLPTEGDNQDMVSLGTHSAFDLYEVTENYTRLTAILLLAATQAIELRGVDRAGQTARQVREAIRELSPFLESDRPLRNDINTVAEAVVSGKFTEPWFLFDER